MNEAKILITAEDMASAKAGGVSGAFGELKGHIGALVGAAAGMAVVFEGSKLFGESIGAATELAGSVSKLQRAIGGSTEDASRLKFALGETGVGADKAQMDMQKFSKALNGLQENEDGTTTKSTAVVKQLEGMGIAAVDASGKTRPMGDVLGQLADQFKTMPNGAEKTALAMQLFGKSGTDLIPFLNKGSEGIKDLEKESDKLGLTLNQNTIDQTKKLTMAHREMAAAAEGLKVQIGVALIPAMVAGAEVMTRMAVGINQALLPAIQGIGGVLSRDVFPVMDRLRGVVGDAIGDAARPFIWLFDQLRGGSGEFTLGEKIAQVFTGISPHLETIGRLVGAFIDQVSRLAQELGDHLSGTVTTRVLPALQSVISILQSFSGGVIGTIITLVQQLVGHWDMLTARFPILQTAVTSLQAVWVGQLQPALLQVGTFIQTTLIPALIQIGPTVLALADNVRQLVSGALAVLVPLLQQLFDKLGQKDTLIAVGVAFGALAVVLFPIPVAIGAIVVGLGLLYANFDLIKQKVQDFADLVNARFPEIGKFIQQVQTFFSGLVIFVTTQFWPPLQAIIVGVVEFISSHWNQIEALLRGPFEVAKAVIIGQLNLIKDTLSIVFTGIGDILAIFGDLFRGNWSKLWTDVKGLASDTWNGIKTLIGDQLVALEGILSGAWDTIKTVATTAWDGLKTLLADAWTQIQRAARAGLDALVNMFTALPGQILSGLGNVAKLLYQAGIDLIQGLVDGVASMAGALKDKVGSVVSGAIDVVKGFGRSPWPSMFASGQDAIQGVIDGALSMTGPLQAAMAAVIGAGISSAAGLLSAADIARLLVQAGATDPAEIAQLTAIALAESGGNPSIPNAQGSGAQGLFQFMPGTARDYGLSNPNDPAASAAAALRLVQGQGYNAWEAHSVGTDQQFMAQAQAAAQQALGDRLVPAIAAVATAVTAAAQRTWDAIGRLGGAPGFSPLVPGSTELLGRESGAARGSGSGLGTSSGPMTAAEAAYYASFAQPLGREAGGRSGPLGGAGLGGAPIDPAAAQRIDAAAGKLDQSGQLLHDAAGLQITAADTLRKNANDAQPLSIAALAAQTKGGDLLGQASGRLGDAAGLHITAAGLLAAAGSAITGTAVPAVEQMARGSGEKLGIAATLHSMAASGLIDAGAVLRQAAQAAQAAAGALAQSAKTVIESAAGSIPTAAGMDWAYGTSYSPMSVRQSFLDAMATAHDAAAGKAAGGQPVVGGGAGGPNPPPMSGATTHVTNVYIGNDKVASHVADAFTSAQALHIGGS